ncbi:MAG: ABC transporter ATP-binding protein, partial [Clostridiales bacterium]|nr:ABC transporter ATP-binding protein [Clostridiales bacterium]
TTMFKIIAGLLHSYQGDVQVAGTAPGFASKALVSYLPEKTYLGDMIRIRDALAFFQDFYRDFDRVKALELIKRFNLEPDMKIKSMSKGMQEKLQLVLVMCRDAELYVLDEPLSGIDPAARDMILDVILHNYSENSSILLSTHLIYDVERIFDDVVIMDYGRLVTAASADALREQSGLSLNDYFREVFKC